MNPKKVILKYKKERALLSDILPYELPLTFSNRHFCEFLLENKVEQRHEKIVWQQGDAALDATIRLLFGAEMTAQITTRDKTILGKTIKENCLEGLKGDFASIPFAFKVLHKENEFRELTICHPRSQLQLVDLYHQYKELILYYCGTSPFSIRRPVKLSRFVFHKDKTHYGSLSDEPDGVEEFGKEYENLRSFFVYRDYSRIYKFYESDEFHRCEKKYNKLVTLDISKCFDSIYTHSLQWALQGREVVKEKMKESDRTFAGRFDKFMRQTNHSETNGIIIGPEFSRIFAELILQSVDRAVCLDLQNESAKLSHEKDYRIFRYVDDYFVFYNDEKTKESVLQTLQLKLKAYKLSLNKSKMINYDKPFITNISMAKHRIAELLDETMRYKLEKVNPEDTNSATGAGAQGAKKGHIYIKSLSLITKFKTIIKEYEIDYKDTLNYTLAIIEKRCAKIIEEYRSIPNSSQKEVVQAVLDICHFTFFIYSVAPRVNTTIRLCRILEVFFSFLKGSGIDSGLKHSVFKLIFDNICIILNKYKSCEHTPVETLYLLIALAELGRDYWLDGEMLCSYFNVEIRGAGDFRAQSPLNYTSLVVLLFYMKKKKRYDGLRNSIEAAIIKKFKNNKATLRKDTELTLLLFDSLACPYIKPETKNNILKIYGIADAAMQEAIISKRQYWFTKWTDFDFRKELDAKQSLEVY